MNPFFRNFILFCALCFVAIGPVHELQAVKIKKLTKKNCRKKLRKLQKKVDAKWNAKIGIQIGICQILLHKYEAALIQLWKFESEKKYRDLIHLYRAHAFIKEGKMDAAFRSIKKVIKKRGRFAPLGFYYLGEYYKELGNKRKAKKSFKAFLSKVKKRRKKKGKKLDVPELGLKHRKKMVKKAKKYLKPKKKKRSVKEKQWKVNAPVVKEEKASPVWDYIYLSGSLMAEGDWKKEKEPTAGAYEFKDSWSMDEYAGTKLAFGVGPLDYEGFVTRLESNLKSEWYTEERLIMEYFQDGGEFFFSVDRWYMMPQFIVDQYITYSGFSIGYQFLWDRTFSYFKDYSYNIKYQKDRGTNRILPWVSIQYLDDFRTRVFSRFEFHPNWLTLLETNRLWSVHLSQDIFFPSAEANLYLEGYYENWLFEATLRNHHTWGGTLAGDILLGERWYFRLILGFFAEQYIDQFIRFKDFGPNAIMLDGKDPDKDFKDPYLMHEEYRLTLFNYSAELNIAVTFADIHQIRLAAFVNNVEGNTLSDYDYLEIGAGMVYHCTLPNPDLIRRKARYGFFGLF